MSPSSPTRLFVPSTVVLVSALVLSLLAHTQAWEQLGVLQAWLASSARNSSPSSVIEIVLNDPPDDARPHDDVTPEPTTEATEPTPEPPEHREHRARPEPQRPHTPPPPAAQPPTPTPQIPTPTPPQPAAPPPPPQPAAPPPDQRAAIEQHSQNPDQANDEARFISDEANTVEEETIAQITSATHDDEHPNPAAPEEPSPADTPGDSAEQLAADMRDSTGSNERRPTPDEADRRDPDDATSDPSHSLHPQAAATGTDATSRDEAHVESGTPSLGDEGGVRALGGQPMTDVMISDGFGSYTVRVPAPGTSGDGGGTTGGHRRDGTGRGTAGHGVYAGLPGHEGGSPREHGDGQREGPQLGLSYTQLEAVYGEDELERERHARLERRRSHARGSQAAVIWDQFRAAAENYIAEVRPGNQTALNAASSPFARFLHDMHIRIHQQYVEHYLASLSLEPDDPLNNQDMHMTLEIAVNPDGSIFRVGVLETSGQTMFDLGAFTAVWRAAPFPHPPSIILSGDGHAWLHWRFDRGPRQCGTWNASPYMLDNGETSVASARQQAEDDAPPERGDDGSGFGMVPSLPMLQGQ